jgi:hypothetical protein
MYPALQEMPLDPAARDQKQAQPLQLRQRSPQQKVRPEEAMKTAQSKIKIVHAGTASSPSLSPSPSPPLCPCHASQLRILTARLCPPIPVPHR